MLGTLSVFLDFVDQMTVGEIVFDKKTLNHTLILK
jgi:hypothetical protein